MKGLIFTMAALLAGVGLACEMKKDVNLDDRLAEAVPGTAKSERRLGPARQIADCDTWAMAVCTEGDRLYAAARSTLYAYDISTPLEPKLLGAVNGLDQGRQIVARNGFVYAVSRESGLRIVDARDPTAMRIRSRFDSVEFATGIDVVGNVAFLSERINGVECVDT